MSAETKVGTGSGRQSSARAAFLRDALEGLRSRPKRLPCKYLYDRRGSELFEAICDLPEYYVTRTELAILRRHGPEMASCVGPRAVLLEPGVGSGEKAALLLNLLERPAAFVPVDISREHLMEAADRLREMFPDVPILPVHADFASAFDLPRVPGDAGHRVVFFPGSTVGNFRTEEARKLLERLAEIAGPGGGLLIGVDLRKEESLLVAAYDDAAGVTAEFNRNLLCRLRDELGADVDPDGFSHRAIYDADEGRVEMHLVSRKRQEIILDGQVLTLEKGETIHTENSYKYTVDGFRDLARLAGFTPRKVWTDPRDWFSVHYLERDAGA